MAESRDMLAGTDAVSEQVEIADVCKSARCDARSAASASDHLAYLGSRCRPPGTHRMLWLSYRLGLRRLGGLSVPHRER